MMTAIEGPGSTLQAFFWDYIFQEYGMNRKILLINQATWTKKAAWTKKAV